MRSPLKACGIALLLAAHAAGHSSGPIRDSTPPSHAAVQVAIDNLRQDPNLGRDKTTKSLRWINHKSATPAEAPKWIVGLFQFVSQGASIFLWVAGGVGLALAAIWVYRVVKDRRPTPHPTSPSVVSHLQDLDIRPASLPADVGAAALALLADGRTRESLSLLYRGALSRAVHNFSVNIDESYTEGEALRAVNQGLDEPRARYFSALVGLWQRAVYAENSPSRESVAALCGEFAAALGEAPL